MTARIWLVWALACVLWSSTFLFIKVGLAEIPPFTFAASRLAIAAMLLGTVATFARHWRRVPPHEVRHILASGMFLLGINYALVYWGAQFVSSGVVAILQASQPTMALLVGTALGTERLTGQRLAAVVAGLGGTGLIFGTELGVAGARGTLGVAAVGAGALCVALSYSWLKKHVRVATGTAVAALQCGVGLLMLSGLAAAAEPAPDIGRWSAAAWTALLYLSLAASGAAFGLNYWLLRRMTPSAMLMMGVAEVPIAVLLGWLVLNEPLRPGMLAGAVLIAMGVVLTIAGEPSAQPASPPGVRNQPPDSASPG
jgi:drug/metabolite transporter (DMT)-like permease